jgi:hypothetical protein
MSNWSRDLLGVDSLSEVSASATISAGSLTLDLNTAGVFYVALNADITTLTISNTQSVGSSAFTLIFTADGTPRAVTWGAAVTWSGGTAPTLTSTSGKQDVFTFLTLNGGTNWLGFTGGQNY